MELCTQRSSGSQEASILTQPMTLDNSLSSLNLSLFICGMGFWSLWYLKSPSSDTCRGGPWKEWVGCSLTCCTPPLTQALGKLWLPTP